MPICTLTHSASYIETLGIHPIEALPGSFELTIKSQLLSAKNPAALHLQHRVIVSGAALVELRDVLEEVLNLHA